MPKNDLDVFKKPSVPSDPTTPSLASLTPRAALIKKIKNEDVRRRKSLDNIVVLDEDKYVERIESIIERDYFPDLKRLKEESETGSSAAMMTATPTPHRTFEQPEGSSSFDSVRSIPGPSSSSGGVSATIKCEDRNLDSFFAKHTSEDNDSFSHLQREQFKKYQMENAWLFKKDELKSIEMKSDEMSLPSIECQADNADDDQVTDPKNETSSKFVTSKNTKRVHGWVYKNVNAVFYTPGDAPLTSKELEAQQIRNRRKIVVENTRINKPTMSNQATLNRPPKSVFSDPSKLGIDGKEIGSTPVRQDMPSPMPHGVPGGTMVVGGGKYSLLNIASPSPILSREEVESPLMTWGQVGSTPLRLDGMNTPARSVSGETGSDFDGEISRVSSTGNAFKIQEVPKRDQIALKLTEKRSSFYRDKKGKALQEARCNMKRGSVGSKIGENMMLSPAAQKFVGNLKGISAIAKGALTPKVKNRPTPFLNSRTPLSSRSSTSSKFNTPKIGTPGSLTEIPSSPKFDRLTSVSSKGSTVDTLSLTDDLLS